MRDITSNTYYDWMFRHVYLAGTRAVIVAEFLATFKEFPPRQKAASFSLEEVVEKMEQGASRRILRKRPDGRYNGVRRPQGAAHSSPSERSPPNEAGSCIFRGH